jgi:hypothetical protein
MALFAPNSIGCIDGAPGYLNSVVGIQLLPSTRRWKEFHFGRREGSSRVMRRSCLECGFVKHPKTGVYLDNVKIILFDKHASSLWIWE